MGGRAFYDIESAYGSRVCQIAQVELGSSNLAEAERIIYAEAKLMDERKNVYPQTGFVHPGFRPRSLRDEGSLSRDALIVLVSGLAAVWVALFSLFVPPEIGTWICAGAGAVLLPALWLTLRHPKAIWRELRLQVFPDRSADLHKLYGAVPPTSRCRTPSADPAVGTDV